MNLSFTSTIETFGSQGRAAQVLAKFSLAFTSRPKTIIHGCNDKDAGRMRCHEHMCNNAERNPPAQNSQAALSNVALSNS